jgi:SAM-dependent methyltransferase
MNSGYSIFAQFYDSLMSDVDYRALADYYNELIGGNGGILLDLACGTGTLSILMAEKGRDVIGVDISQEMLSNAASHEKVSYICQDISELDLYGTIDACICSLDGLNHLADEAQLKQAIERVSLFMNPGGVFVFDVNTIYKHETILGNNIFVKEQDGIFCVWRNFYQHFGIVDIVLDIFDVGYARHTIEIREKAYPLFTIRQLCEQAGFKVAAVHDFMKKSEANETSEKVVFVCRKI